MTPGVTIQPAADRVIRGGRCGLTACCWNGEDVTPDNLLVAHQTADERDGSPIGTSGARQSAYSAERMDLGSPPATGIV
jgi:hypothetical protein